MIRTMLVALATLLLCASVALTADLGKVEEMASYTPDCTEPIAPVESINFDQGNPDANHGLSYRNYLWLLDEYSRVSKDESFRFAGCHMVVTDSCGDYQQCGTILDLLTGRPVAGLPLAGPGGYEFSSNCDYLGVHPTDSNSPDKVTEVVFYRLVSGDLVRLFERSPDCITYGTPPVLPIVGPVPQSRPDEVVTGSIN